MKTGAPEGLAVPAPLVNSSFDKYSWSLSIGDIHLILKLTYCY